LTSGNGRHYLNLDLILGKAFLRFFGRRRPGSAFLRRPPRKEDGLEAGSSADPLRQLDDDPLRAADLAEPIAVFVALHLANELRAAGSQASDEGADVVDREWRRKSASCGEPMRSSRRPRLSSRGSSSRNRRDSQPRPGGRPLQVKLADERRIWSSNFTATAIQEEVCYPDTSTRIV